MLQRRILSLPVNRSKVKKNWTESGSALPSTNGVAANRKPLNVVRQTKSMGKFHSHKRSNKLLTEFFKISMMIVDNISMMIYIKMQLQH